MMNVKQEQSASGKPRLLLAVEGTEAVIRIVPHNHDSALVVLKSRNIEQLRAFAKAARLQPEQFWKGPRFAAATVSRDDFLENLPLLVGAFLELTGTALPTVPGPEGAQ